MHTFLFTWFKFDRYGKTFERKNKVTASSLSTAEQIFHRSFGSPHEVCIMAIHELDSDGNMISVPIKGREATMKAVTNEDDTLTKERS